MRDDAEMGCAELLRTPREVFATLHRVRAWKA